MRVCGCASLTSTPPTGISPLGWSQCPTLRPRALVSGHPTNLFGSRAGTWPAVHSARALSVLGFEHYRSPPAQPLFQTQRLRWSSGPHRPTPRASNSRGSNRLHSIRPERADDHSASLLLLSVSPLYRGSFSSLSSFLILVSSLSPRVFFGSSGVAARSSRLIILRGILRLERRRHTRL